MWFNIQYPDCGYVTTAVQADDLDGVLTVLPDEWGIGTATRAPWSTDRYPAWTFGDGGRITTSHSPDPSAYDRFTHSHTGDTHV